MHSGDKVDRVANLPIAWHRAGLEHRAHEGTAHGFARAHAVDANLALRGSGQAKDDVEEGTLACAVNAEDSNDFSGY